MIESVFISLTDLLYQSAAVAIAASFLWGILSVVISPCHLGSVPLIVAFVNGQPKIDTRKAFLISLVYSLGILISISTIGLVTGLAGKIMGDIGTAGMIVVVIVFFAVGLNFLGVLPIPDFLQFDHQKLIKTGGYVSALLLGLLFGFALGPCTFAFMAPILAIAFNSASKAFLYSVAIVGAYALGHSLVFVIFGTSSGLVKKLLKWDQRSGGTDKIKKVIGVIIILTGVYIAYKYIKF